MSAFRPRTRARRPRGREARATARARGSPPRPRGPRAAAAVGEVGSRSPGPGARLEPDVLEAVGVEKVFEQAGLLGVEVAPRLFLKHREKIDHGPCRLEIGLRGL